MKNKLFIFIFCIWSVFFVNAETLQCQIVFPKKDSLQLNKTSAANKSLYLVSVYNNGCQFIILPDGNIKIIENVSLSPNEVNYNVTGDSETVSMGLTYFVRDFSADYNLKNSKKGENTAAVGKGSDTVSAFNSSMLNAVKKTKLYKKAKRKKKQVKGFIQPTTQFETLTIGARFVKVQAGFNISESK